MFLEKTVRKKNLIIINRPEMHPKLYTDYAFSRHFNQLTVQFCLYVFPELNCYALSLKLQVTFNVCYFM